MIFEGMKEKVMGRRWEDQDIEKALKGMGGDPLEGPRAERLWMRIETHLLDRQRSRLGFTAWRPWSHPVRWVAAAAFLAVGFSGLYVHRTSVEQGEMASYLLSVSGSEESLGRDSGLVKVSQLLTEPAVSDASVLLDEDQSSSLETDDIYL